MGLCIFAFIMNMFCYHGIILMMKIISKDVFDGIMVIIECCLCIVMVLMRLILLIKLKKVKEDGGVAPAKK